MNSPPLAQWTRTRDVPTSWRNYRYGWKVVVDLGQSTESVAALHKKLPRSTVKLVTKHGNSQIRTINSVIAVNENPNWRWAHANDGPKRRALVILNEITT